MLLISARRSWDRNDKRHVCISCKAKSVVKPQNRRGYWTTEKRIAHGESIRSSPSYYEAIANRDTSGKNNGMFGKRLSVETRAKMSRSRTGKTGANATAWKGGKGRLVVRVKGYCHRVLHWYARVYERDRYRCTACGSKTDLDAHHVDPISSIIKRLCAGLTFTDGDAQFSWLIQQPEIIDAELRNGKTLCRKCHKQEHAGWGSHDPKVQTSEIA